MEQILQEGQPSNREISKSWNATDQNDTAVDPLGNNNAVRNGA